ncbi:TIGR03899 family protein [Alteromonas sp. C1M14]|uniref:TIGR03899 family protein n=1 Tax=Alteromonas sp. C1M14 TaxID=2841567 RepID=UPI001C07F0C0|nr:TIGR03899 family protein [Alteromonas sp. C1M14]MBU2976606.1 TIGR03899 family protein [Alteromonas sp. C1M14]
MKISDTHTTPSIHHPSSERVKSNKTEKKVGSESNSTNKTASQSAAQNAARIQSLFAQVGVRANVPLPDSAARRKEIDRRRDIQALQRIKNLQAVMEVALSVSLTHSSTEHVDPDWFFAFTQLAENIHSPAMQSLWGQILAVEISQPGAFSLRSLETLKVLTQRDAKLFARAVGLSSRRLGDTVPRILVGVHQRPSFWSFLAQRQPEPLNLASFGLSYPDILALTDMKLIFGSEIESGELTQGQGVKWRCGSHNFNLTPTRPGLALVYYKFTSVGAELAKLINRQTSDAGPYLHALSQRLGTSFIIDHDPH